MENGLADKISKWGKRQRAKAMSHLAKEAMGEQDFMEENFGSGYHQKCRHFLEDDMGFLVYTYMLERPVFALTLLASTKGGADWVPVWHWAAALAEEPHTTRAIMKSLASIVPLIMGKETKASGPKLAAWPKYATKQAARAWKELIQSEDKEPKDALGDLVTLCKGMMDAKTAGVMAAIRESVPKTLVAKAQKAAQGNELPEKPGADWGNVVEWVGKLIQTDAKPMATLEDLIKWKAEQAEKEKEAEKEEVDKGNEPVVPANGGQPGSAGPGGAPKNENRGIFAGSDPEGDGGDGAPSFAGNTGFGLNTGTTPHKPWIPPADPNAALVSALGGQQDNRKRLRDWGAEDDKWKDKKAKMDNKNARLADLQRQMEAVRNELSDTEGTPAPDELSNAGLCNKALASKGTREDKLRAEKNRAGEAFVVVSMGKGGKKKDKTTPLTVVWGPTTIEEWTAQSGLAAVTNPVMGIKSLDDVEADDLHVQTLKTAINDTTGAGAKHINPDIFAFVTEHLQPQWKDSFVGELVDKKIVGRQEAAAMVMFARANGIHTEKSLALKIMSKGGAGDNILDREDDLRRIFGSSMMGGNLAPAVLNTLAGVMAEVARKFLAALSPAVGEHYLAGVQARSVIRETARIVAGGLPNSNPLKKCMVVDGSGLTMRTALKIMWTLALTFIPNEVDSETGTFRNLREVPRLAGIKNPDTTESETSAGVGRMVHSFHAHLGTMGNSSDHTSQEASCAVIFGAIGILASPHKVPRTSNAMEHIILSNMALALQMYTSLPGDRRNTKGAKAGGNANSHGSSGTDSNGDLTWNAGGYGSGWGANAGAGQQGGGNGKSHNAGNGGAGKGNSGQSNRTAMKKDKPRHDEGKGKGKAGGKNVDENDSTGYTILADTPSLIRGNRRALRKNSGLGEAKRMCWKWHADPSEGARCTHRPCRLMHEVWGDIKKVTAEEIKKIEGEWLKAGLLAKYDKKRFEDQGFRVAINTGVGK